MPIKSWAKFAAVIQLGFLALCSLAIGEDTVQVKNVAGLHRAFEQAQGHVDGILEIVLAKGEYILDQPLKLVAAKKVRVSGNGARIIWSGQSSSGLVIAYCDDIQIHDLTLTKGRQPTNSPTVTSDELIHIDHSTNVHLKNCSLEFSATYPSGSKMKVSPIVVKELGEQILAIVSSPDKVRSYKVNATTKKAAKMLGNHAILESGPDLTADQQKRLIAVILDQDTYLFGIAKNGFQSPEQGFEFVKGDQKVGLLVDLFRNEFVFLLNGKELTKNCDPAAKTLATFVNEVFSK